MPLRCGPNPKSWRCSNAMRGLQSSLSHRWTFRAVWDYPQATLLWGMHMKIQTGLVGSFRLVAVCFALALLFGLALGTAPARAACSADSLAALKVPNMTFTSAAEVAAAAPTTAYCDVKGAVATSGEGADSGSANFEIMLPQNWNGKFVFRGVGGLAGVLNTSANPADQPLFLERGYATAITDTGHLVANPTWEYTAPGTPDMPKVVDYFYRAVHQVTLAAKQLVKAYYQS